MARPIDRLCGPKVQPAAINFADLQAFPLARCSRRRRLSDRAYHRQADAVSTIHARGLVDGRLVTSQPLDGYGPGNAGAAKPFVFGINGNEGVVFAAMTCAAFSANDGIPNPDPAEAAQCLPAGAKASMMDPSWYDAAIAQLYGQAGAARIRAFTDGAGKPYDAHSLPGTAYYNAAAQAMAAVVGADNFVCANLRAADRVSRQAPGQPVYAYVFTQPPLFDLYAGMGTRACAPEYGQVCHGDELAFVFDTLAVTSAEFAGTLPVPAADRRLAQTMCGDWSGFARDLVMPGQWRPYGPGGEMMELNADGAGMVAVSRLAARADCPTLWDHLTPLGRSGRPAVSQ